MMEQKIWAPKITLQIAKKLEDRYQRPFVIQQSAPFNQPDEFIEVYFNDLIMNQLHSDNPNCKANYRYGFMLRYLFNPKLKITQVWVGFIQHNPVIALNSFIRNVRTNHKVLGKQLHKWLQLKPQQAWLCLDKAESIEYIWDRHDSEKRIINELSLFGGETRSIDKLNRHVKGRVIGTDFTCERELIKFRSLTEKQLLKSEKTLVQTVTKTFSELNFLYYQLWPQDRRQNN